MAWLERNPLNTRKRSAGFARDAEFALGPQDGWQRLMFSNLLVTVDPGTPPVSRGYVPPNLPGGHGMIYANNNPNNVSFPSADYYIAYAYRNWIGYRTYVQFMMDWGRDVKVVGSQYSGLSTMSPDCPYHTEGTAGGSFSFPPREQPAHACRRALIAAIQVVKDRNESIPNPANRDWVSIVSYDTASPGPVIVQAVTGDYDAAMLACTTLQSASDKVASTSTEAGLITARGHIKSVDNGGMGRKQTDKVVVLLTDGMPNLWQSGAATIDAYLGANANPDFYTGGYYWLDAPLMQVHQMQAENWMVFPVGIGLGTDYNFMDRLARIGSTANSSGESPRGSGNPAEYEQRLIEIFENIIKNPRLKLVD